VPPTGGGCECCDGEGAFNPTVRPSYMLGFSGVVKVEGNTRNMFLVEDEYDKTGGKRGGGCAGERLGKSARD